MKKRKQLKGILGEMALSTIRKMSLFRSAGDDYVDQFLFDTKKGYCDNFSTSMVVMFVQLIFQHGG